MSDEADPTPTPTLDRPRPPANRTPTKPATTKAPGFPTSPGGQELFAKKETPRKWRPLTFVLSNCNWEDGELVATSRQPFDTLAETTAAAARAEAGRER